MLVQALTENRTAPLLKYVTPLIAMAGTWVKMAVSIGSSAKHH
jgi:hypothetical protein